MHDGCNGNYENGKDVIDKVRAMGFANQNLPMAFQIQCEECNETFEMTTFEDKCPNCGVVYAVTPCHAFDPSNVMAGPTGY